MKKYKLYTNVLNFQLKLLTFNKKSYTILAV